MNALKTQKVSYVLLSFIKVAQVAIEMLMYVTHLPYSCRVVDPSQDLELLLAGAITMHRCPMIQQTSLAQG